MKFQYEMKSEATVYLAPSKIDKKGIGVFTDLDIKKGEFVRVWDDKDCKFVSKKINRRTSSFLKTRFCVETKNGYWCPLDWIRMSVGWYLNHSDKPNLKSENGDDFYAIRNIKENEELTIDYSELDDDRYNVLEEDLLKIGFYDR